ncbi:MAG TPA: hypothetical protein VHD36_23640 [Pirellulales bacterium]|nr:hypothetical protein [Pirellulales bacterium]HWA99009.1 hypothetical protein [Pirellulales bacterium]
MSNVELQMSKDTSWQSAKASNQFKELAAGLSTRATAAVPQAFFGGVRPRAWRRGHRRQMQNEERRIMNKSEERRSGRQPIHHFSFCILVPRPSLALRASVNTSPPASVTSKMMNKSAEAAVQPKAPQGLNAREADASQRGGNAKCLSRHAAVRRRGQILFPFITHHSALIAFSTHHSSFFLLHSRPTHHSAFNRFFDAITSRMIASRSWRR